MKIRRIDDSQGLFSTVFGPCISVIRWCKHRRYVVRRSSWTLIYDPSKAFRWSWFETSRNDVPLRESLLIWFLLVEMLTGSFNSCGTSQVHLPFSNIPEKNSLKWSQFLLLKNQSNSKSMSDVPHLQNPWSIQNDQFATRQLPGPATLIAACARSHVTLCLRPTNHSRAKPPSLEIRNLKQIGTSYLPDFIFATDAITDIFC